MQSQSFSQQRRSAQTEIFLEIAVQRLQQRRVFSIKRAFSLQESDCKSEEIKLPQIPFSGKCYWEELRFIKSFLEQSSAVSLCEVGKSNALILVRELLEISRNHHQQSNIVVNNFLIQDKKVYRILLRYPLDKCGKRSVWDIIFHSFLEPLLLFLSFFAPSGLSIFLSLV